MYIYIFVSSVCHAQSNEHKPLKTVAPTVLVLENLTEMSNGYLIVEVVD